MFHYFSLFRIPSILLIALLLGCGEQKKPTSPPPESPLDTPDTEQPVISEPLALPQHGDPFTAELPNGQSMEFVWIESGSFYMGYDGPNDMEDLTWKRPVAITNGFFIGKYEITQQQWEAVMGPGPWHTRRFPDPDYPALYISWDKTQEFIHALNAAAGDSLYRLPTEAEWEYSCRAGTNTRWSFGDDEDLTYDYAWVKQNSGSHPHPVGTKLPNPWGLYDMHGNIWEWCQDFYAGFDYFYQAPFIDPPGPAEGTHRVKRSGIFRVSPWNVRSAMRKFHLPDSRVEIGARLVRRYTGTDDRPPVALILHPSYGTILETGDPITLSGMGLDPEDGELTDLRWRSSIDGPLQVAADGYLENLSIGDHTITLEVIDSWGAKNITEITLTINP